MITLQTALEVLNNCLKKDKFTERFQLTTYHYTCTGKDNTYDVITIPHSNKEYSIELEPNENDEWIFSYLGTHIHIYFVETIQDVIDLIYEDGIKPVLKDEWVTAHGKKSDTSFNMTISCYLPKEIPFAFSEEEKTEASNFKAVCWSGKSLDETALCYIISDRKDIEEFRRKI